MYKILITAFDAFGANQTNPSEKLLSLIPNSSEKSVQIVRAVLPTIYGQADKKLLDLLNKENPDLVVMLGYSRSAHPIKLELMARNRDSKLALDNLGKTGSDQIIPGGPGKLRSALPIEATTRLWGSKGISYAVSSNAGGFLCNHVFYIALDWLGKQTTQKPCGFIHVGARKQDIEEALRAIEPMLNPDFYSKLAPQSQN